MEKHVQYRLFMSLSLFGALCMMVFIRVSYIKFVFPLKSAIIRALFIIPIPFAAFIDSTNLLLTYLLFFIAINLVTHSLIS